MSEAHRHLCHKEEKLAAQPLAPCGPDPHPFKPSQNEGFSFSGYRLTQLQCLILRFSCTQTGFMKNNFQLHCAEHESDPKWMAWILLNIYATLFFPVGRGGRCNDGARTNIKHMSEDSGN